MTDPGRVTVVDRPDPRAVGDIVTVRIEVAPLCTEFKDRQRGRITSGLGHEAAGVVLDAGMSRRVHAGDRVVVMPQYGCGVCWLCTRGDHIYCPDQRDVLAETESAFGTSTCAQVILKPDWLLLPIPDDVSMRHAAMTCCALGPTFNAVERMQVGALDTVVVSGCGPVGAGGIVNARARGARVIALEPHPYRAALAARLGAELVLDPSAADIGDRLRDLTDGRGAHAGIETSGFPAAAGLLAGIVRRRGKLAVVAWGADVNLPPLVPLGLDVHGCWHWNHQRDAEDMWCTVRRSAAALDTLVTHEFGLEDISKAMDVQDSGACGKVLLFPGADHADERDGR